MNRRQSMSNGYQNPPGMKLVPTSYQQEPIPMMTGSVQPFQAIPMTSQHRAPSIVNNHSFKNNRVAPPPMDYNPYSQPNDSFETPISMKSTKPLMHTGRMYSQKQPGMDTIYPNQPYYADGAPPDDDIRENNKQTTWLSQKLCLGLTRLSGGILFGTMLLLGAAALAGLVTSVVLYVNDIDTDPQWKILGMVVSAIMLLTVFVTLCIFIYCYKKGRIVSNGNENNSFNPNDNQRDNQNKPYNYNQSYDGSAMPYGMIQNVSPVSMNDDIIQVKDKQTNTEETNSPLRPRNFHLGVWPAINAYGGKSYRPPEAPNMVNHFVQAFPTDIDKSIAQRKHQLAEIPPKIVSQRPAARHEYIDAQHPRHFNDAQHPRHFNDAQHPRHFNDAQYPRHEYIDDHHPRREYIDGQHPRREYFDGQRPRHFNEAQPQYEIVEDIVKKPRGRLIAEEYVEIIELPKKAINKQKYNKVSVTHVKTVEQPDIVDDDLNTDHFYQ